MRVHETFTKPRDFEVENGNGKNNLIKILNTSFKICLSNMYL